MTVNERPYPENVSEVRSSPLALLERIQTNICNGRFRINKLLEEGGMASIYSAYVDNSDQLIALKVVDSTDLLAKRFSREAEIMGSLHHENIVKLLGVFEHGSLKIISMELLGECLAKSMSSFKEYGDIARLFATLAHAVHYIHKKDVIHRDLKPENILFLNGTPKIIDFGLAVSLNEELRFLIPNTGLGTLYYVSPEQASGTSVIDLSADIYSLGAILYECLTGQPRFPELEWEKAEEVLHHVMPMSPKLLRNDVPTILNDICMRCIKINKIHRYRTAEELAQDLDNFVS